VDTVRYHRTEKDEKSNNISSAYCSTFICVAELLLRDISFKRDVIFRHRDTNKRFRNPTIFNENRAKSEQSLPAILFTARYEMPSNQQKANL
jgi:hypothetical protein